MNQIYDVAIVGGGPAGLAGGLYASRARLRTVVFERLSFGGQVMFTDVVENYPGVTEQKGMDLAQALYGQAERYGTEFVQTEISQCTSNDTSGNRIFNLTGADKGVYRSLSIIIATGAHWRKLGVPGEEKFQGKGVSYCATCDAPLFRGKDVMVVGGGNAAVEEAMFLARFARTVTLVHRRRMLRAAQIVQEQAAKIKNITFEQPYTITEIRGSASVESVAMKHVETGDIRQRDCQGVFIFVGLKPNTDCIRNIVQCDTNNYVITDEAMHTSCEGIFAAGDVRKKTLRQIVTATADGAIAAYHAEHYVRKLKGQEYK